MDKLLELLDNLLAYLLYGGEEELHKHKQLRKIWKDLRNRQLRYIDKKGNKIHTHLPSRLLHLFRLVQTLQDLLPLGNERQELLEDEQMLAFLITSRIDESAGVDRSTFTYSQMRERIAPLENQEREWQKIEKELEKYLGQLEGEQYFGFNTSAFGLEHLYALVRYDFNSLLGQFSSSSIDQRVGMHPSFVITPADQVQQDLLDLYFVIAGFEVNPALRRITEDLLRYFRKDSDSNKQVLRETLDQFELLLESDLAESTLRGIVQLIMQDPYYEPKYMKPERNYLQEFSAKVRERFGYNRERLRRELLHERVEIKVEKIFGDQELLSVGGYNRENDQYLADNNFPCFSHLHPMEIIKTYAHNKLSKGFLGSMKKIVSDGYFEDRNYKIHLDDAVQRSEGITENIEQFEQYLQGRGGFSFDDVRKMLEREKLQGREAQTVNRFIQEVNGQAKKLTEKATNILFALYQQVEIVVSDHKSNNPKHISNVRVIGGDKNSDIMHKVRTAHSELGELLDVLRKYAVIYQEEQKDQE